MNSLKTIHRVALVDEGICNGCGLCSRICPVLAINVAKIGEKKLAVVEADSCHACTICVTRCPQRAVTMAERRVPLETGIDVAYVSKDIEDICHAAHMYPDQIICYCHRVQAKEVVKAILDGAKTPEAIASKTGARTGCGVLCITGVIRLLAASGIELEKAPGYQWYGVKATIWDISKEIMQKYPQYYMAEDLEAINDIFP